MTVVLDGTPIQSAPHTGIATYTRELTAALTALHPEASFELASSNARLWWSVGLPWRLWRRDAALFHGTDFAVPLLGGTPSVVTVHDLSPLRAREWNMPETAYRVAQRLPGAIRRARAVIVPSERIKEEIVERFGTSREKIFVTPLAAGAAFRPNDDAPESRYVLYVGSGQQRKNLDCLLRAWQRLAPAYDANLVVVGGGEFALQSGVTGLKQLEGDELARLYAGAAVFVYPSRYEGFGLPVVEAMACGAPVIVARDTACADVAGDAAMLVDGASDGELESAIRAILDHPVLAAAMREKSLQRAAGFSWQRTAELTWNVYENACK